MKFLQSLAAVTILITVLISCKKENISSSPAPTGKNKIVYIYKGDPADGNAFKSLMQGNNCSVTLLDKPGAISFDYSSYNLIVVGSNTDGAQTIPDWSTAEAMAIDGSGKRVLLTGTGGLQLALKLNNKVNYGFCASSSLTSFVVANAGDAIYKTPKAIPVSAGNPLTIFSSASYVQSFNSGANPTAGVSLIGNEGPGSVYYPVAIEMNRYGVFGFTENVNAMTAAGKDFMVNMVYQVGKLSL